MSASGACLRKGEGLSIDSGGNDRGYSSGDLYGMGVLDADTLVVTAKGYEMPGGRAGGWNRGATA